MGYLWIQVVVVYQSDDGNSYNVGLSSQNVAAGGFSPSPAGSIPNYPKSWRMRHVIGIAPTDSSLKHKLPIATTGVSLWTELSGTFSIIYLSGSQVFNLSGRLGEKRRVKILRLTQHPSPLGAPTFESGS